MRLNLFIFITSKSLSAPNGVMCCYKSAGCGDNKWEGNLFKCKTNVCVKLGTDITKRQLY